VAYGYRPHIHGVDRPCALLPVGATNGGAICARTGTGRVGRFSIWFVRFRWLEALRSVREAFRRRHRP
jgi:hypothetical protein